MPFLPKQRDFFFFALVASFFCGLVLPSLNYSLLFFSCVLLFSFSSFLDIRERGIAETTKHLAVLVENFAKVAANFLPMRLAPPPPFPESLGQIPFHLYADFVVKAASGRLCVDCLGQGRAHPKKDFISPTTPQFLVREVVQGEEAPDLEEIAVLLQMACLFGKRLIPAGNNVMADDFFKKGCEDLEDRESEAREVLSLVVAVFSSPNAAETEKYACLLHAVNRLVSLGYIDEMDELPVQVSLFNPRNFGTPAPAPAPAPENKQEMEQGSPVPPINPQKASEDHPFMTHLSPSQRERLEEQAKKHGEKLLHTLDGDIQKAKEAIAQASPPKPPPKKNDC